MKVVGVDERKKVVFVDEVSDGLKVLEWVEKGYKVIKVGKIKAL